MVIFEKNGVITPAEDKSNIELYFDVPEGVERLFISYCYSPKTVEGEAALEIIKSKIELYGAEGSAEDYLPVKNLITLSLDDCNGYRGAAHRHINNQQHEIGRDFASPGFEKGTIGSGRWRAVLNVHCCACDASFSIKITGEESL